jgi:hypothetical protein
VAGATDSGVLVNSGTVNVADGGTLTIAAGTLTNAGSILVGSATSATLLIDHNVTLSGGGTVTLAGLSLITDNGGGFTLTNVNDKIVGAGALGAEFGLFINNQAAGVIDGNGFMEVTATINNAGLIEATAFDGLFTVGPVTNSGTMAALGTGARLGFQGDTVVNSTTKALILASGNGAQVILDGTTISGGTFKTSAGGEILAANGLPNLFSGITVAASSLIEVTEHNTMTLKGGTIGAGALIATSDGAAIVSGTLTNGGTLFAAGAGLVEIASGAVINGGVALIGDGIVDIAGSSGESVRFLSDGSGGLEIADTVGHTSAYSGRVSGFGGSGHSNGVQFIDLVSVTSSAGITSSYVSANAADTSGTLFISSGGTLVAAIKMAGSYSAGNFHITSGAGGSVAITDPTVPIGGSVEPGVAHIATGAHTTLAYSENSNAPSFGGDRRTLRRVPSTWNQS